MAVGSAGSSFSVIVNVGIVNFACYKESKGGVCFGLINGMSISIVRGFDIHAGDRETEADCVILLLYFSSFRLLLQCPWFVVMLLFVTAPFFVAVLCLYYFFFKTVSNLIN